jgi:hypothetical protein
VGLTFKQSLFVEAYLGEAKGNATKAAKLAGYGHAAIGRQLLRNITIQARIAQRLKSAAMPANEVLARLSEIASGDIGRFIKIGDGGWGFDIRKIKRSGRIVKKLKSTVGSTELELHSPLDALDKLARHHGLYKAEATPDLDLEAVRARLKERREALPRDREPAQLERPAE